MAIGVKIPNQHTHSVTPTRELVRESEGARKNPNIRIQELNLPIMKIRWDLCDIPDYIINGRYLQMDNPIMLILIRM